MAGAGHTADRQGTGDEKEEDQCTRPEKPLCPAVTLQHPLLMKTPLIINRLFLSFVEEFWLFFPMKFPTAWILLTASDDTI